MEQHPITTDPAGLLGSLWVDGAHHHRLVRVIRVLADSNAVLLQPVRDQRQHPASYPEPLDRLAGADYRQLRP
jgi:hypothetical protein